MVLVNANHAIILFRVHLYKQHMHCTNVWTVVHCVSVVSLCGPVVCTVRPLHVVKSEFADALGEARDDWAVAL